MQLFAHLGQVHGDRALLRPDPVVLRRRTRRRAGLATRTLLVPTSIGRRHDPPLHAREVHPPENAVLMPAVIVRLVQQQAPSGPESVDFELIAMAEKQI